MIGNLSASDLRGVAVECLIKTILRPAKKFLELVRGLDDAAPVIAKYPRTCHFLLSPLGLVLVLALAFSRPLSLRITLTLGTRDDTLGSVVQKVSSNHMHRVWVVDDQGKLDSCVSLTDICRVFTELY